MYGSKAIWQVVILAKENEQLLRGSLTEGLIMSRVNANQPDSFEFADAPYRFIVQTSRTLIYRVDRRQIYRTGHCHYLRNESNVSAYRILCDCQRKPLHILQ